MAVYTEVGDDDLATFLSRYQVGSLLSYKGIAEGVENTNYVVHTTTGTYILTLYEKRVDPADLPYFLGLTEHLAARGVSCPVPVRDCDGSSLGHLAGRHAALVTFLEGFWHRKPLAVHCEQVGAALAEMHLAGAGFHLSRKNTLGPDGWRPLFEKFAARAGEINVGIGPMIAAQLAYLDADWPAELPRGIIHADLFPDNVFFIGDTLSGLIDFYFACNDWLAYDLAICLNAWCFDSRSEFELEKARQLLAGYHRKRPLTMAEQAAMPTLARGAAMRFLLTRSYDWLNTPAGALVSRKDPMDYAKRLAFHRGVSSIADYGFTGV